MALDDISKISPDMVKSFLGTIFQAQNIKAVQPRSKGVALWEDWTTIGNRQSDQFFTKVRCYCYPATPQFNTYGVFLSFRNAKGGAFAKIDIEDLRNLALKLHSWIEELEKVEPALKQSQDQVDLTMRYHNAIQGGNNGQPGDFPGQPGEFPDEIPQDEE